MSIFELEGTRVSSCVLPLVHVLRSDTSCAKRHIHYSPSHTEHEWSLKNSKIIRFQMNGQDRNE